MKWYPSKQLCVKLADQSTIKNRHSMSSSTINIQLNIQCLVRQSTFSSTYMGAQWLSGRVLDLRPRGRGFESHRRHCVVHIYNSLVLVQPRKIRLYLTGRWLMGRKESSQTNKLNIQCRASHRMSIVDCWLISQLHTHKQLDSGNPAALCKYYQKWAGNTCFYFDVTIVGDVQNMKIV